MVEYDIYICVSTEPQLPARLVVMFLDRDVRQIYFVSDPNQRINICSPIARPQEIFCLSIFYSAFTPSVTSKGLKTPWPILSLIYVLLFDFVRDRGSLCPMFLLNPSHIYGCNP